MVMPLSRPDPVVHPWSIMTGMILPPPVRISMQELRVTGYTVFGVSRYASDDSTLSGRVITSAGRNWIFGHHGNQIRKILF